ncbi:LacI family DNA-binding transcriptional regulator [Arthrobacter cryoconiti]|uniref:LacI family DNA-binding transcriptional regulator n=1 Tax=Arthrobacter cryoconiti TaxID=748907 RepID=A0ABV8QY89_9MICC|nr:LacI family DNA-binding transcriptional regulator [Arthrobacter cryoconiti]MCC9069711.1 LacI family transcriptional regulator [Arthrobacter cryoconiti]
MTHSSARRRDVTVADVAKAALVSKAQAARALGGYGAVSEDVRERVLAAAESLSYRPNELARTMNTGKSHTIGVVVGDIENPHFGLAMRGISDRAKASGFDVILINTGEDIRAETDAVRVLLDKRVDGLIVAPVSSPEKGHLERVCASGRPLVLFDRKVDGLDVDVVATDMTEVSRKSTAELIHAGHERIAFISTLKSQEPFWNGMDVSSTPIAERLKGMSLAFHDAGHSFPSDLVRLNAGNSDSVVGITQDLLRGPAPATAIVASDGLVALGVVEGIQTMGLSIPQDVSFLMYDDLAWTRLTNPPLSVISQPVYDMGAAAAAALIQRIQRPGVKSEIPEFTATLINRGSIGAVRGAASCYSLSESP